MSGPATDSGEPVTDKSQLIEYLADGCKPPESWLIGSEHEQFLFRKEGCSPLPYNGTCSIHAVLEGLQQQFDWQPVVEGTALIALSNPNGNIISLEPGGQIELSNAPLRTVHAVNHSLVEYHSHIHSITDSLRANLLALGFHPSWRREEIHWVPKERYAIMRAYMPRVGKLGLDMMLRTCTIQVSLDYGSEADMVRKYRVALALQPIATALFANSPFVEGTPSGFLSYRSHVWTDTDPDRCGMVPFVFAQDMGFERYVDYMLDVPLYFVYHKGRYIDACGQSFRDFMTGRLPALPGVWPTLADWTNHLTTAFPEVRLKRFLEMRGVDGGSLSSVCALSALWVGLLYQNSALDDAWTLIKDWTTAEQRELRYTVPRLGLRTPFRGQTLREVALTVLDIARNGLRFRRQCDEKGQDECFYLEPLFTIAESGKTPAEHLLNLYFNHWAQSIEPLFNSDFLTNSLIHAD